MPRTFPFQLLTANLGEADSKTPVFARSNYWVCTMEYILSGRGTLEEDGQVFNPGPGDIYILHKGSNHRYWPDRNDPWKKYFLVFDGALMSDLFRMYRLETVFHIPKCTAMKKYFESFLSLPCGSEETDRRASVLFHQLVHELSDHVYRMPEPQSTPPEILKLKEELDSSLEQSFSLADYADRSHFSEAHLIRMFRSTFGLTPYNYLLTQRLEAAKRLLSYSTLSIKEIASRLVFSDQYYFSNCFKRKNGVSPLAFRKKS